MRHDWWRNFKVLQNLQLQMMFLARWISATKSQITATLYMELNKEFLVIQEMLSSGKIRHYNDRTCRRVEVPEGIEKFS